MVAVVIDLNIGRNLITCCLKIYSSKVYIGFICFSLPELLLSSPTKKEIDMLRSYRNLTDEAMQ